MTLLHRANEAPQTTWIPVPEGLWRFGIGIAELKYSEKYGNYQVRFPLQLTLQEQNRLLEHLGDLPPNTQPSYRVFYTVGLSLGYVQKDGQYKSTKLIDFLSAALGTEANRGFRQWIAEGGGPPRPDDLNDQAAELKAIEEWLRWWEDLEVYGSVAHHESDNGTVWANFSGPLAVGSLPGQKDNEYTAHGRGKLKAIKAESGQTRESHALDHKVPPVTYTPAGEVFTGVYTGGEKLPPDDDLPF